MFFMNKILTNKTKQSLVCIRSIMLPCTSLLVDSENKNRRCSVESCESDENVLLRNKPSKLSIWRPSSLVNLINQTKKRGSAVFESTPSNIEEDTASTITRSPAIASAVKKDQLGTIVSVVVVEAKGLPNVPSDGTSHVLYCKIRLGSHASKSKSVSSSQQPVWQERFQFSRYTDNLLRVSLWDKGKLKSFMGSCVLDLSQLEKERTHEVWQALDDGFGKVHLSVTMCNTYKAADVSLDTNLKEKHAFLNLRDWKVVGELQVKVVAAKGLIGKLYCTLEVDNERVRTHAVSASSDINWDKSFVFNVYDVTSTLDLKVYDSSIVSTLRSDSLGRVSIPLLRINNGEMQWYALKDRRNRNSARGNCPRVLLDMSLYWNPIKASLKVFTPKEVKYNKKVPKFDISLVYKNIEFIRDTFDSLLVLDEGYKTLFEWKNREYSCIALFCWLFFWYHFRMWAAPLMMLVPFLYFWIFGRHQHERSFMRGYGIVEESEGSGKEKIEKSITARLQELPDMTITITSGIEFIASLTEKIYNLASFKVPFLSYLTMFLLVVSSFGLYLIPFNYIMMIFGLFKFSRKYLDPERILNNDLVDFLSRIPNTEELINWKELNVPEPAPRLNSEKLRNRSCYS